MLFLPRIALSLPSQGASLIRDYFQIIWSALSLCILRRLSVCVCVCSTELSSFSTAVSSVFLFFTNVHPNIYNEGSPTCKIICVIISSSLTHDSFLNLFLPIWYKVAVGSIQPVSQEQGPLSGPTFRVDLSSVPDWT